MNCQDISSILDDRAITGFEDVERDLEAHLHECGACASEWAVQQRLAALRIPPMPATLAKQCRTLVAAQPGYRSDTQGRRRTSRLILIGGLAAMAAAAALLGMAWRNSGEAPVPATATELASSAPPVAGPAVAPATVPSGAATPAPVETKKKVEPAADSPRFTVRVLPLKDETTDEPSRRATTAFYTALLDRLSKLPGVTLVKGEAASPYIPPGEYQLAVTGSGPVQGNWNARMMIKASVAVRGDEQGPRATVPVLLQYSSVAYPLCTGSLVDHPVTGCSDPEGGAASQVDLMRLAVFPPDPSLRRTLKARLLDRALAPEQRWKALESLRVSRPVVVPGASAPRLTQEQASIDADMLRGAVDLAATAPSVDLRAQVWRALRDVRLPELVQPLIDASKFEADDGVRLEAVATLATDYAQDPKARAALESIAGGDASELVRMVAQRAISGDKAWTDYLTARLQDESLPDARRIEALMYAASSGDRNRQLRAVLDAKAVEALSVIIPRTLATQGYSAAGTDRLRSLIGVLASTNQPTTVSLLASTLNASSDPQIRRMAVTGLARHLDDARAREALQEIAAHDTDPMLREAAGVRQPQLVTPPPGT
jgi:hypothetical protein